MLDSELDMYRDPSFKVLKLQGTPKAPQSAMTLAWNSANKKVMVAMKGMKLPSHDKNHQFQLWALVSGKPVDMGVFDAPAADTIGVKEMKAIASAEAFAVTIEPVGGSVNPTMDQMVVIGKF
jgi:anti-sigma-K factor RskA